MTSALGGLARAVRPSLDFQGALQGAGTPNQAGIGGFLPLSVGDNSVWFVDALINANFATVRVTAASSTPMWLAPPSAPQRVLAIAGSMLIAVGCSD